MVPRNTQQNISFSRTRLRIWYGLLLLFFAIIIVRLFYIQVVQHNYYKEVAFKGQYKQYEIPAERGIILAHDGDQLIPIVLNQDTYTLFADPKFVKDPGVAAQQISDKIGGNPSEYEQKMRIANRYSVLKKRLNKDQKTKIESLDIKGIGTRVEPIRTYPQGSLAAQILGFVNDEGVGNYGIEQFLDSELRGKNGELRAITDAQGVPLVSAGSNVLKEPESGKRVELTIDINMQRRAEGILKSHLESVRARSGSVVVIDPYSGAVKAMANYPSYNPAGFYKVRDPSVFTNAAVSSPIELGSIMKTLTMATGLNEGVIKPTTTFYDPAQWKIDGHIIKDVAEDGPAGTRSTPDILKYSLNSGAVYILMQLGGGQINQKARTTLHSYFVNRFHFGQPTGIEQGYESGGEVADPNKGYGLNIRYANMSFGQGLTVSPLQMAAAFSSTINGGTYYRPHLVEPDKTDKTSYVLTKNVVKPETSKQLRAMHEATVKTQYTFIYRNGYRIGAKTGTPEIPNPAGGYYTDRTNGTFVGYIGGNKPEYVIMVTVIEPHVSYYAGIAAAAPLFDKVSEMLIDNFSIRPKTH